MAAQTIQPAQQKTPSGTSARNNPRETVLCLSQNRKEDVATVELAHGKQIESGSE